MTVHPRTYNEYVYCRGRTSVVVCIQADDPYRRSSDLQNLAREAPPARDPLAKTILVSPLPVVLPDPLDVTCFATVVTPDVVLPEPLLLVLVPAPRANVARDMGIFLVVSGLYKYDWRPAKAVGAFDVPDFSGKVKRDPDTDSDVAGVTPVAAGSRLLGPPRPVPAVADITDESDADGPIILWNLMVCASILLL